MSGPLLNFRRESSDEELPFRVVSGGQTGVDRAALDAARQAGISIGGWCPRGRRAEDGVIPDCYPLQESADSRYAGRTRQNVVDSDATLIVARGMLTGGTALTARIARRKGRLCRVWDLQEESDPADIVRWIVANRIRVLNVAGPRESQSPGIYQQANAVLTIAFGELDQ